MRSWPPMNADQHRLRTWAGIFLALAVLPTAWAEPADLILSAGHVVTMDAQRRVIANGAVAIRGARIAAVGTRAEIDKRFQSKQRIDEPAALLIPGLINTHTHAPMALLRGIADDMRLQDWLEKFIFPAEAKNVTPEFVRWGTRLACAEMLLSGHDHVHRHVLLRGSDRRSHERVRHARHPRTDGDRIPRSGREDGC